MKTNNTKQANKSTEAQSEDKSAVAPVASKPASKTAKKAAKRVKKAGDTPQAPGTNEVAVSFGKGDRFTIGVDKAELGYAKAAWESLNTIYTEWERRLKAGEPDSMVRIEDPKTGEKVAWRKPSFPSFSEEVDFLAPPLRPHMRGGKPGKKVGESSDDMKRARAALIHFQRENKSYFTRQIAPKRKRIISHLKKLDEKHRRDMGEMLQNGKAAKKVRVTRKSLLISNAKK